MRRGAAAASGLAALALVAECGDDEPSSSAVTSEASTGTVAETVQAPLPTLEEELPGPVRKTWMAIADAASAGDYEALEPIVDAETFLSDAGFGVDPIPHWREGAAPLEAMVALLGLPHTVRETNEGTLYQWPRFMASSAPEDMSEPEKAALTTLLGQDGLAAAFQTETGYVGPRLGILADGRWWFFILESAP